MSLQSDNKITVDDKLLAKLVVQFPTVDEGHIFSVLKQYNNRENVAIGALLAEVGLCARGVSNELIINYKLL